MRTALVRANMKSRWEAPKQVDETRELAEPLDLELVTANDAATANAFYGRRPPLELTVAGESFELAAAWPPRGTAQYPTKFISFRLANDDIGEIEMPQSLVDRWLMRADDAADLSRLKPAHAALLLEAALADEISWLESRLQCRIALTGVDVAGNASGSMPFAIALARGGKHETCALHFSNPGWATRLGRLMDEAGHGPPIPSTIPLRIGLRLGAVNISIGELKSLSPGDVVLLDHEEGTSILVVEDLFFAPVTVTGGSTQIISRPTQLAGSKWEWTMNQVKQPQSADTLEDSDLEGLPVTLVFEAGRAAMPLGEIKRLAPGSIVPLPDRTDQTVDIVANGKRVGQGELVRIGEGLGVRILRIFDNA